MRKDRGNYEQPELGLSRGVRPRGGPAGVLAATLTLALLATGCLLGPKFKTPAVPTEAQWREAAQQKFTGEPVDKIEWWKVLNDPILDSLIRQSFAQNLTLQDASLRVVQARLARTSANEYLYIPILAGGGSISNLNFSTNVKPEVELDVPAAQSRVGGVIRNQLRRNLPTVKVTPELDLYDAGFDAIYELDLWGKKRQLVNATGARLGAAYAGYDDIMISVAAEVARTYVDIRTTNQRLSAMRHLYDVMNGFVALTEERYQKKEVLVTDVKLAKLLAGIVQTSIPQLETALRQQENALCLLLGKAPQPVRQDIGDTGTIPVAPVQTAVGIPADLLRRRPDVRLAEFQAAAQCAHIGIAKAAILPSFSIFGSIGLRSSSSEKFFRSDSVRSAYGGLLDITPLLLYPFTVENVRLQDTQFEEALLQYKETVLNANREVENNMFAFLQALDETAILEENVRNARDAAPLTEAAYKEGKVIVSIPLAALTFLASQEDQMWQWRGMTTTDYIAIYKALGGGWQNRVGQELVPEPIREQMKKQADWWSFTGKWDLSTVQDKGQVTKPH